METATNADASTPQAYKEAIDNLAASISACVGADLLPRTAKEAVAAFKQEATMKTKLDEAIESVKQSLREAIATAKSTRESAPLADHLAKQIHTDDVLRDSCDDLLKELRREELRRKQREKVRWMGREGHARTHRYCTQPQAIYNHSS